MSQLVEANKTPTPVGYDAVDNPGFSQQAATTFGLKVEQFSKDLAREAAEIAVRNNSDIVSASDIEHAHQQLLPQRDSRRRYRHLGNLAGIVLGVGLSNAFGLANSPQGPFMFWVTITVCVVASFTVAFSIAKD